MEKVGWSNDTGDLEPEGIVKGNAITDGTKETVKHMSTIVCIPEDRT